MAGLLNAEKLLCWLLGWHEELLVHLSLIKVPKNIDSWCILGILMLLFTTYLVSCEDF